MKKKNLGFVVDEFDPNIYHEVEILKNGEMVLTGNIGVVGGE